MRKSTKLITYLLALAVTVAITLGSIWSLLFPEKNSEKFGAANQSLTDVAKERAHWAVDRGRLPYVWGLDNQDSTEGQDADLAEGEWDIRLEGNVWHFSGGGKTWLLHGTILEDGEYCAVFSTSGEVREWKIVKSHGYFDNLFLSHVSHDQLHLVGEAGRDWVLGLYHLKNIEEQE